MARARSPLKRPSPCAGQGKEAIRLRNTLKNVRKILDTTRWWPDPATALRFSGGGVYSLRGKMSERILVSHWMAWVTWGDCDWPSFVWAG